ncbi:MAG: FHA domain-containing protein, partial [Acidimicrobiia bacterium]
MVSLHVNVGGTDHLLTDDDVATIGRDPSATIRVEADGVSRRHARISLVDGTWLLADDGSRFGVFHNGAQVQHVAIDGPTTVRLGDPQNGLEVTLTPA